MHHLYDANDAMNQSLLAAIGNATGSKCEKALALSFGAALIAENGMHYLYH